MQNNSSIKLILTNRVNIAAISSAIYTSLILYELFLGEETFPNSLLVGLFGSLFAIIGYGFIFWIGFLTAICVLDSILIVIPVSQSKLPNLNVVLILEWMLISIPLVLWAVSYGTWVFIVGSLAFLASQLLWRKRLILEIFGEDNAEQGLVEV
jgi:hypothetical protein